jgi:hypothetical protein
MTTAAPVRGYLQFANDTVANPFGRYFEGSSSGSGPTAVPIGSISVGTTWKLSKGYLVALLPIVGQADAVATPPAANMVIERPRSPSLASHVGSASDLREQVVVDNYVPQNPPFIAFKHAHVTKLYAPNTLETTDKLDLPLAGYQTISGSPAAPTFGQDNVSWQGRGLLAPSLVAVDPAWQDKRSRYTFIAGIALATAAAAFIAFLQEIRFDRRKRRCQGRRGIDPVAPVEN